MVFQGVFLFLMVGMSLATPEDLSGKMFTFPQETGWAHVRITTSRQYLNEVTVCLRYFTDLSRDFSVFSLATSTHQNGLLIFKKQQTDLFDVFVRDSHSSYGGQDFKTNTWQSVCVTWSSDTGLTQLWLDGAPSSRKSTTTTPVEGPMIIVLGQEQDSHGGGFDIKQSFVGMISDLHMWNYPLSSDEILNYSHKLSFTPGNLLKWDSLEYHKTSQVLVEDDQV